MPPTMMVTCGESAAGALDDEPPAAAAPLDPEALLAQAAMLVAARRATPAAPSRLVFMNSPLSAEDDVLEVVLGVPRRRGAPLVRGWLSLDCRTSVGLGRTPAEQPALEDADQTLGGERDDCDQDHAGEDAVHVEVVLRGPDQQAQALVGAEDLADQGADEGEAEADVQAREDPGEGRRQDHVAGHLPARGPKQAGVGDEVAVHLARPLVGVE